MYKRILSLLMTTVIILGSIAMLPENPFDYDTSITASAASTAVSGKCGKNVSWSLDPYGNLIISGSGEMYSMASVSSPFSNREDIKNIVIKKGVTSIGSNMFYRCKNLSTVSLPNSITYLGYSAFSECKKLTNITIPKGVVSIDACAFFDCENLSSITIPSSVKSFAHSVFESTKWLNNMRRKNPIVSVNGILIDGKACKGDIIIPSGIKSIVCRAFYNCSDLKSVTIPGSVKTIETGTFEGCKNLTSVTMKNGVKSIDNYAFAFNDNLENISIPKSVSSIGGEVFYHTKWLQNMRRKNRMVIVNNLFVDGVYCYGNEVIPDGVTAICSYAFDQCNGLKSVTIPNSVKSIGDSAFYLCKDLTSINIPGSVKSIGYMAFNGCESLSSLTISYGVKSIGNCAFWGCNNLETLNIPNSVQIIGNGAFWGCDKLKSVNIPNGINSINNDTFNCCSSITSIKIPESVTSIGISAFHACRKIKSLNLPSGIKTIGKCAFDYCDNLKSINIPRGVTTIDNYAFSDCKSLKSITIPSSVTYIGEYVLGYYTSGGMKKLSDFTIYGVRGTTAEKYADRNRIRFVALDPKEPKSIRFAGNDRAETASLISSGIYKTADTVIIATGFDFHDALAAVPLASAYNAPLLLADRDNLSAKTISEIKRLKAKNVIVVATITAKDNNGNDAAIKKNVYTQLNDIGVKVTKLTGSTYYATAKKTAEALAKKTKAPDSVFITTDKGYADALTISPIAAIKSAPIIYVDPKAALDNSTKTYLASINSSVKNVYIVGGVNAVSKNVEKAVLATLGKTSAKRYAGDDRYDTCIKINNAFASVFTGKYICITTGQNFPDALAGGVYAALRKSPLMMVNGQLAKLELTASQTSLLRRRIVNKVIIFGGKAAVSSDFVKLIAKTSI